MKNFQKEMNKAAVSYSVMGVQDGKFGILTKWEELENKSSSR